MVRRKDPFWMYVEELENGRFSCNFCKRDFAGGISRIKSHLSGLKGRDIQICPQVPEAIKLEAQQAIEAIDTPTKRAKSVATSNTVLQGENTSGSSSSHMPNLCKGQEKSILDMQLARFLLSEEGISLHAVQSPLFKAFVNGIAEYGPGYQVPSYIGFNNYFKIVEGEVDKYVQKIKDYSDITGCTLIYNKSHRKSLVEVCVYTPIGVVCINVFCLNQLTFDSEYLSTFEGINHKNVVQLIINDLEGDFVVEISSIFIEYPWIYRTRCPIRGIKLLLRKIYWVPFVYNTIQVARWIGRYIYKNKVNVPYLRKKVNGRFRGRQRREDAIASSFFMLTSLLEVENELQDLREPLELRVPIEMASTEKFCRRARFTVYVIRCKEFWSRAKMVAQVMRPIFQALCLVRCESPTLGYYYEMMESVKDALEQYRDSYHVLYDYIRNILDGVRSDTIHPIHAAAAFLNPMYMCSEKFKENDEMKNGVIHILEHSVAVEEKEDFMKQVKLYHMKDSNVFTAEAKIKLKTSHPLTWWEHCGNHISVLQKYAIRIFSQPCSSSLYKQYKPLPEDILELPPADLYPHEFKLNAILMERYESKNTQIIEPIILEKLKVSDEVNYQLLFKNESDVESDDELYDDGDDYEVHNVHSRIESDTSKDEDDEEVNLVDWSHRYADDILKDPTGSWLDGWPRK